MDHRLIRVVQALCEDVATPRALSVLILARAGEWTQLCQLRIRPQDYFCSESYLKDALVTELLRKAKLNTDVDKEAAAVATFLSCEAQNATTNARLSRYLPKSLLIEDQTEERVFQFITEWRKEVNWVLGNLPDHLTPRFSGGATFGDVGTLITVPDKMSSTPTITQGARCLVPPWGDTAWARALVRERPWQSDPQTVRGNIFFTVPKDAEKHRGCCKEPSINVTYQLDVGKHMKYRLARKLGIDLLSGQTHHRDLAAMASETGLFATIDLSNASDTICRVLPRLILREDWYSLLDSLRSHHTRVGGKWYRLEKFSSMGNGFTFELETLLYATLARQVVRQEGGNPDLVSAYGDDMIVPSQHASGVMAALAFFGFTPNAKKTFVEGPFRESCGGDFYNGVPVRAHYIKELPDEPQQWISLANGLRRVATIHGKLGPRWDLVRRAWLRCLDNIPSDIRRCKGPVHLGDIVIHDDESRWEYTTIKPRRRWTAGPKDQRILLDDGSGPAIKAVFAYSPVPLVLNWNHWTPAVQLASCTIGAESAGVTPRGGISGYVRRRVPCELSSLWTPIARV